VAGCTSLAGVVRQSRPEYHFPDKVRFWFFLEVPIDLWLLELWRYASKGIKGRWVKGIKGR